MRAHALVPLLLLEAAEPHREAWVARARWVSVRRLEDEVDRALGTGGLAPRLSTRRPSRKRVRGPRPPEGLPPSGSPLPGDAFEAMCEHACETNVAGDWLRV